LLCYSGKEMKVSQIPIEVLDCLLEVT
jgi:hypothetical protein